MGNRKKPNNGEQLVNKKDLNLICTEFINFYYKKITENLDELFNNNLWKSYSIVNLDGCNLEHLDFINFCNNFLGKEINILSYQFVPDGSRRLDIMVKCSVDENIFVQNFALVEVKENFYIKSTQIYFI